MSKVFISYSHDSAEHNERVLQFSNALRNHGVDAELDRYHVRPPKGWPHWCEEQLRPENSTFVLMICTEIYLKRIEDKVPADEGRGVFWEGAIIYDYLYDEKGNTRFIPVLFADGNTSFIPIPIRNHTRYRVVAFDLTDAGYQDLYRELTGQPLVTKPPLGEVINLGKVLAATAQPLEPRPVKTDFPPVVGDSVKTDISRILKYAPEKLIGREDETKLLSDAWAKVGKREVGRPHVLTFVALGGEGKTSLVAKWAAELASQDWPGCDAAFAWSFYSQGTREQLAASSDLFLKEALTFFGDPATADSARHSTEKGKRLAELIGQRRSLLILDGLEPLQYAPTSPTPGELKDQGIAALLKGLAAASHGLCVVTTRYSLPDLRAFWQTTAPEVKLPRLSSEAGVALLKRLGVKGNQKEFETLVEDVKGHALTLNLLGSYLHNAHAGDIRKRDLVKLEEADAESEHPHHAFHVLDTYVKWLENGGKNEEDNQKGLRALAVLRLLGLFDRPVTADCLNALLKAPAIPGLTEPLIELDDAHRNIVLNRLEAAKLLTVNRDAGGTLVSLDAHPLLREYFARQVRGQQPDAWRAAHRRLYEHLCATTPDKAQPTIEDLQPLYKAVAHGCQAELQQEAHDKVHLRRIRRGREEYSTKKVGAFGSELGAEACFFEQPWSLPSRNLTERDQIILLGNAAYDLQAMGRLTESLEPLRVATVRMSKSEEWDQAAVAASNLSELELSLGEVAEAVGDAEQSVTYADRSDDAFWKMGTRTMHADALHQAGRRAEAETRFRQAEQMQTERQPDYPLLYSLQGFKYCDLLLADAERSVWRMTQEPKVRSQNSELIKACRDVEKRAAQTIKWAEQNRVSLLDLPINHLTLGRTELYKAILTKSEVQSAKVEVDLAMAGLRRSSQQNYLPLSVLTRALLRSLSGEAAGAQEDLDEAWEIAERGPMKLFLADIHLHRARLFFREKPYPWNKTSDGTSRSPQDDLAAAEKLINDCGYHRRDEELADAKKAIIGK
jgi:tetratricopeptide (TPR) repeat protein